MDNPANPAHKFSIILAIMVLAGSTSIMSTDLYAPSLPYLTDYFATTPELMKLTISLNLIIFGLAQLIYGPLSDRFGRRPVFLWSIMLFCIASIACAFAQSIEQLLSRGYFRVSLRPPKRCCAWPCSRICSQRSSR